MKAACSLSPLGLGTGRLASLGSGISRDAASHLIRTALDHGIRMIDTADTYGSGDSERAIGGALRNYAREEFFLITKAGFPYVALPAVLSPLNQIGKKILQRTSPKRKFSRKYLLRSIQASLKRLNLEYVDAFLLHAVETGEVTSETWEALQDIRDRGLSRMTGVSTKDPELLRQGIAEGQVSIVETPINSEAKNADEISCLCAAHHTSLIANEVLKPRSTLLDRAEEWDAMRARHGVSQASTIHLLIAYALAQPAVQSVAMGSTSPTHLVENLQALQYVGTCEALFKEMKETFQ